MIDFFDGLQSVLNSRKKTEREDFWKGHSVFQVPYSLVAFRGKAEALTLLYLYERAGAIPFRVNREVIIGLQVREETIAKQTGLTRTAVSYAISTLEAGGHIRVNRNRDSVTGRAQITVYLLLHPVTREPLKATPNEYGICHSNAFPTPYLTVPKETREVLTQLRPAARAVYITALAIASKFMQTAFAIRREDLKRESLLGRNGFNRGFAECRSKSLFTHKRHMLTLNDPRTRKPSERTPRLFVYHDHPNWRFDLDTVSAEKWQGIVEGLLRKKFFTGAKGWTYTRPEIVCPFCTRERSFSVNFAASKFQCHGCGAHGRFCQLVAKVLRCSAREAKEHIAANVTQNPPAQAA